ncbi:transcription initiation factor IIB [Halomicrobium salinisoli]|uniref:transcription initiation factor IIB n=1 Tax=Halomicrobium salinisoli TaxID=2878391 RepID=UPI001CEFF7E4|nr:transcription initiation factor IIB family protein [Halomicrobium salinisoli]
MAYSDTYSNGFDESTGQTITADACPECDGRLRTDSGETRCTECGLVVEGGRLDRRGSPTYPNKDGADRRTGQPRTTTRHDRGLSTRIGRGVDAKGNTLSEEKRRQLNRLRREHSRARYESKADRNLAHGLTEIARMRSALGLSRSVREQASSLFRTAQSEDLLLGRSIEAVAAGSLYAVCRLTDATRTLDEVSAVASVSRDRVQNGYDALNRELALPVPPQEPTEFIPGLASALELSSPVERDARTLANRAVEEGLSTGLHPAGFAAACLGVVATDRGEAVTQRTLADVAGVTPNTIRKHRDRIRDMIGVTL